MKKIFSKEQKVKFSHCDFAGIVFYPRFMEMLNELVEDWFEEALGYSFLSMHPNNGIPTVDLQVQFRTAARLGDVLTKKLWVTELTEKSLTYAFEFTCKDKTILKGTAVLVHVTLDKIKGGIKAGNWHEETRKHISAYII